MSLSPSGRARMRVCAVLFALAASPASVAQDVEAVLDFAEHGQVVAVETLRTPGVWEGQIVAGTFAGGWVMRIQTSMGEVVLANSGSAGLQSLPSDGGRRRVHFMDKMPACGGALMPPDQGPEQGGIAGNCDDGTVLDVLVKWTPTAEIEAGGPTSIRALAEAAVAMSNHVYIASGVNVYMRAVGYGITEPFADDAGPDVLGRLTTDGDGVLDGVHAERDATGADLVALLTGPSSYCGVAWLLGDDNPNFGFSVTVWGCVPGLTFSHEVGHNQGCCHAPGDGGGCFDQGVFPYSVGHRFFGSNGVEYRTVMAYAPGERVPRLSSPLVSYMSTPTGLALADNALTVRETAAVMANFRCGGPLPEVQVRSPLMQGPEAGGSVTFNSSGVVPAGFGSQVMIVTTGVGDLGESDEHISLRIGSTELGLVLGGSGSDCRIESRITSLPAALFNTAIGDGTSVQFELKSSAAVGSCAQSEIAIEFRYMTASGVPCVPDINADSQVDGKDLAFVLSAWGTNDQGSSSSDINNDGVVDGQDLAAVLAAWGSPCSPPGPTLVSVAPTIGPTSGGTTITLTGTNLADAESVTVGGVSATNVQVIDATTLTAVTPAGMLGAQDVTVTTLGGTATRTRGFTYVNVPTWATLVKAKPTTTDVPLPVIRDAIIASGYAWRVRDTATQIEMVLIPPGTFQMGCSASVEGPCDSDESPTRLVNMTRAFYMGVYEVTQAQWTARMGSNPSVYATSPDRPVDSVSWNMVQGFLSSTGMRLPTEAEWEYAYRAQTGLAFHGSPSSLGGDVTAAYLATIAWFAGNNGAEGSPEYGSKIVGLKQPNGHGLHDMSGNVIEWVNDWYSGNYYAGGPNTDPSGPASGTTRVLRGGGWLDPASACRSSERFADDPSSTGLETTWNHYGYGFRVARNPIDGPTLTSVSPTSGPTTGGTTITLTGTNLTSTTSVRVGGDDATNVQVVNSTTVTAVTPELPTIAGSDGIYPVDVTVTTAGGTAVLEDGFTYLLPPPTLFSVSPASGPTAGGTLITVSGTNLAGTTFVTVGGVPATDVQVLDGVTVTAVTPAGTAGAQDVSVTTPSGTVTLPNSFTYANVTVPSWATLVEAAPSAEVVTNATLRTAIAATGYPWLVRDTATQIEMVLIPPGTFQMGCSPSNQTACGSWESPVRTVTLTQPFYMGRYEVTQAQWTARMGSNPSSFQSASAQVPAWQVPNRPVEQVSWNTVQGFLSATGMRLPTEAEWEHAYRAGTTTAFHSMPDQPNGTGSESLAGAIAWIGGNAVGQTRPVSQKAGNGLGLHDMSGNVWEWVADWYGNYPAAAQTNPTGPSTGTNRVIRGGCWSDVAGNVRSSVRYDPAPTTVDFAVGFRVARNP